MSVEIARYGGGEPLLYLHGLADVHSIFDPAEPTPFLEALARERQVLAPALPGYGGSDPLGSGQHVEDHVFWLLDLLDDVGLARVDIVGHSIGGWLAAELALRRSDRVGRLALLAPLGLHVAAPPAAQFFGAVAPRGLGGFGETRAVLFADPQGAIATGALPDDLSRDRQLRWFGGLAGAAAIGWHGPELRNPKLRVHLRRLRVPTVIVGGSADRIVPPPHIAAWNDAIAGSRAVTIADAGHALVLEHPLAALAALYRD